MGACQPASRIVYRSHTEVCGGSWNCKGLQFGCTSWNSREGSLRIARWMRYQVSRSLYPMKLYIVCLVASAATPWIGEGQWHKTKSLPDGNGLVVCRQTSRIYRHTCSPWNVLGVLRVCTRGGPWNLRSILITSKIRKNVLRRGIICLTRTMNESPLKKRWNRHVDR